MKKLNKNGDLLEREYYNFISQKIKSYECIWNIVIGQDYENIAQEKRKNFRRIAEYQYTCLESIICIKLINEKKNELDTAQSPNILKKILEIVNNLFLFEAHMGRIYETLERVWTILNMKNNEDMKEFYHHRHNVIHSHKLPLKIEEGLISIPILKAQNHGKTNSEIGWNDRDKEKRTWDDFLKDDNELQFLTDYFNDTERRLVENFEIALKGILSQLKEQIKKFKVSDSAGSEDMTPEIIGISGTTISFDNSAIDFEIQDSKPVKKKKKLRNRKRKKK